MYELIIKRINTEFLYSIKNIRDITDSDSIFTDFLLMLFDPDVNIKTKSYIIRNTQDIKNKNNRNDKNKFKDVLLDSDIFHLEL